MGYQLWTSPITGYRRKGTRLAELRSLLGSGITADAILEPLQSCPADASAITMAELLTRRGFDVAGVRSRQDDPVTECVSTEALRDGVVRDHSKPIIVNDLISDNAALHDVLSVLGDHQHVFVLIGSKVRGIVTRADLNKPPVRVYLFGLVSLLEMHLGYWTRVAYPEDSWRGKLRDTRLKAAEKVYADRRERHQETSLAECLQFCDLRDLVLEDEGLRGNMGLGAKADALRLLKRAEDLRNALAHSQQELVQGSSWEDVIKLVQSLETVVHTSDERVEQKAGNAGSRDEDGLWMNS